MEHDELGGGCGRCLVAVTWLGSGVEQNRLARVDQLRCGGGYGCPAAILRVTARAPLMSSCVGLSVVGIWSHDQVLRILLVSRHYVLARGDRRALNEGILRLNAGR